MTIFPLYRRGGRVAAATGGPWQNCFLIMAAMFWLGGVTARAIPSAPAGVVETGAPAFVVLGMEVLGLSSAPLDLHLLPDGRVLVASQHELAFGDGARWEAFHGAEDQPPIFAFVAVDDDGLIYTAVNGGFARVDLGDGARWRLTKVASLPGTSSQNTTLASVAAFPDRWFWYGGNDKIVSWRPGQTASDAGKVDVIDRIFTLGKEVYVSNQSSGALVRLTADGTAEPVQVAELLASESVTCAIPFEPGKLLVGTASAGLKIFDGKISVPFGQQGLLDGKRIADLCAAGDGYFAAAVDSLGIIFFDRAGHVVQMLERSLDRRLAGAKRLGYARDGVLWALLNDGVVRVEFPSPVSHYEPLLENGLVYAEPLRHAGQLWILADGRAMRGIYGTSGLLEHFQDDTPPGRYLFTLREVDGRLFATNDGGIYVYGATGWTLVLPGIVNARFGVARSTTEGIFYVARGEYGVIRQTGEIFSARRIKIPELADSYNSAVDDAGIGWLELGMSQVGRFDANGGNPSLQIFGAKDGLALGWVELYLLDGVARFHVGNHLHRFDDVGKNFVEDTELLARIPQLAVAGGRPVTDSLGRLWYTANGATQVIDRTAAGGNRPVRIAPVGFAPTSYTTEDGGLVWMFEKRRLARMDLRLTPPPASPLRALITSVQFPSSGRQLFKPAAALEPLEYADNSLVVHFAAPANPFAAPVTFEVLLEGAGSQWISTGAVGSATYNRLKEGDYVFRVRPVAGGAPAGAEARFQFAVRPPWFRTALAWVVYCVVALGLFAFAAWLASYLQRRENERLERLVAKRTGELNATNAQLGRQIDETVEKSAALSVSEERYRLLNTKLEERVVKRTAELSQSNDELQQREVLFRLIFEHAPVGISWKRTDLGDVYHINPTFRRILDLPSATLSDYGHLATLVHPEDAPRQIEMNRLIATGQMDRYTLEERFVLKDGRLIWGLLSVAVVRDETGRTIQEIGILEDTTSRKRAEEELAITHQNLLEASRQAGMAEVAIAVLHNVGNVLNSVNVSATLIADQVHQTKAVNLGKIVVMLNERQADLADFITRDARGQMIPSYLDALAETLAGEQKAMLAELDHLRKNVEHIKDIVAMQQANARTSGIATTVEVSEMIEDALRINADALAGHDVATVRDFRAEPVITTDKHKVMQILINLVRNAGFACDESGRPDKQITVRVTENDASVQIAVIDNGVGIPPENLTRIFNHGFTTRKTGHGFGLHSGALAARELGGSLAVLSDGPGSGATFILELPCPPSSPAL